MRTSYLISLGILTCRYVYVYTLLPVCIRMRTPDIKCKFKNIYIIALAYYNKLNKNYCLRQDVHMFINKSIVLWSNWPILRLTFDLFHLLYYCLSLSLSLSPSPSAHQMCQAGAEPGELGVLRTKLLRFLQTSRHYEASMLATPLHYSSFMQCSIGDIRHY